MTTAVPSAAFVVTGPVFTKPEQLALAGFLASYTGLTRQAYMRVPWWSGRRRRCRAVRAAIMAHAGRPVRWPWQ